jgi:hypothetical protein
MYNREPELYLPIDLQHWDKRYIDVPDNSELPIFPMTWRDDIELRNPDGLMNGSSLARVIERRIPCIKSCWHVPEAYLTKLIAAINLATNGPELEMRFTCNHCSALNEAIIIS